jgi:hypothetical protein
MEKTFTFFENNAAENGAFMLLFSPPYWLAFLAQRFEDL